MTGAEPSATPADATVPARFLTPAREALAFAAIAAMFLALGWESLIQKSVTYDEFLHLPAGLSYLRTGDFRIEPFNSPLVREVLALPVWHGSVKLPLGPSWSRVETWSFGREFMYANTADYQKIFVRCRLMNLLLAVLLLILVWRTARGMYGPAAGLAAAALLAWDPTFMAHARLVTTDVGAALAMTASVLSFRAMCLRPTWPRIAAAGVLLGAALLCKFSAFILLPLFPVLLWGYRRASGRPDRRGLILRLSVVYAVAWFAVCGFYHFEWFGAPLRIYTFQSTLFRGLQAALPEWLRVPFPYPFVQGLDLITVKNVGPYGYLLGEMVEGRAPYYYLVALAVKTPLAELVLMAAGLGSLFWAAPRFWRDERFLAIPAALLFIWISLFTNLYIGVRYLLPAYPLLAIISSRLFSPLILRPLYRLVPAALLAGVLASNLLAFPDYLAYFNAAAGGPSRGYRILADSNLDWGQDLIKLKRYMKEHGLESICLAYFGRVDPAVYGIKFQYPYDPEQCEVLAVSVEYVLGFSYVTVDEDRRPISPPEGEFSYLLHRVPDTTIGHSIWIFDQRKKR